MKKTWLFPAACTLAALAAPSHASASSQDTLPGILYVPSEPVMLYPGVAGTPECVGAGGSTAAVHSGLGCTVSIEEPTEFPAYGDAVNLTENLTSSLADFDVTVTNTRPPKYLPFTMLVAGDEVSATSLSNTCAPSGIDCSTLTRKRIGFTIGGSMNCMDPDPLHAALYAFGRMSGLEGTVEPTDAMFYPPDFTMPVAAYADMCVDIALQILFDKKGNPMPAGDEECAATDAHNECMQPDDAGLPRVQNSYQHMLLAYGAAPAEPDTEAPTIEITAPADGEVFMADDTGVAEVMFDATVADNADTWVGAQWTLTSQALLDAGLDSDTIEVCTNQACAVEFTDAPAHALAIDGNFSFGGGFPAGEYTLSFEAADMHGNVADAVSVTFTIEGAPSADGTAGDETAGGGDASATAGDAGDDSSVFTTGADGDGGDGTGGGSTAGEEDDTGGCACNTGPGRGGIVALMFGLLGLGLSRRRS